MLNLRSGYTLQISTSSDPTPVQMPVTISATGAAVLNASLTTSSLLVGATASYTYDFVATSGLPVGSTITVVYPAGFNLSNATKTQYISNFTIKSIVGQTITYNVLTPTNAGDRVIYWYMQTDGIINPSSSGAYTLQISTSSDPTTVQMPMTISPPIYSELTLYFAGTGGGDVNGEISCSKGATCSPVSILSYTKAVLMPTADGNSLLSEWSSECTVVGDNCEIVMNGAKTVTVTFNSVDKARIWGKPYSTLAAAFSESNFGQIKARSIDFIENINVTQAADFLGGHDKSFNHVANSFTVLKGKLTIKNGGRLKVDGLVIRPTSP